MRKLLASLVLFSSVGFSQSTNQPTIHITELPPDPIPAGTCKESYSGYLEISDHGKIKNTNLTPQQIGSYIKKRLGEGYSLELYPQASRRLFIIETCRTEKH